MGALLTPPPPVLWANASRFVCRIPSSTEVINSRDKMVENTSAEEEKSLLLKTACPPLDVVPMLNCKDSFATFKRRHPSSSILSAISLLPLRARRTAATRFEEGESILNLCLPTTDFMVVPQRGFSVHMTNRLKNPRYLFRLPTEYSSNSRPVW